MNQLRAMEIFARVVELKSFTKAAHSLRITKAAATSAVQELELVVGVRLLRRTTRSMSLTEDGNAYLSGALRVLADVAEINSSVRKEGAEPRGTLRVDVPASAGRHVLAPALPDFFRKYPSVTIELGSSDRTVDLMAEGIDCVIRGGPVFDESLIGRKLGTFETVTCAAPKYLKQKSKPKNLEDLVIQQHVAINYFNSKLGQVFPLEFEDASGRSTPVSMPSLVASNDADTHLALACEGLGLAQIPYTRRLSELIQAKRLVRVLASYRVEPLPLHVLYPRQRHMNARLRVFVDWVVALYKKEFSTRPHVT
jgi:LysR family transcriptional regulator, regulator for bpeEF and oprC